MNHTADTSAWLQQRHGGNGSDLTDLTDLSDLYNNTVIGENLGQLISALLYRVCPGFSPISRVREKSLSLLGVIAGLVLLMLLLALLTCIRQRQMYKVTARQGDICSLALQTEADIM